jgi:membrane protein DedA with SNARE-associated domain
LYSSNLKPLTVAQFLHQLQLLDPLLICLLIFAVAFIENIFPPSPSDMIIVFAGSLVGLGIVGFPESLLFATLGSTLGFIVMYKIGDWFGVHILESRRFSFIPVESVKKAEAWFVKYGYWVIVANRFLAGTRAVVSFFAGMSELSLWTTTVLCFASALLWNGILLAGGYYLGHNWERIGFYLVAYSRAVTAIVLVLAALLVARYVLKKRKKLPEP